MTHRLRTLFNHYWLLMVVFVTGAAVLVVEVAAIRVLSPYFGNTLYMTSSVLSVILAALSAGYYLGGRLADKKPSEAVFFGLILAGGISLSLLQMIKVLILPLVGYELSTTSGPLIISMLMFFVPAALFGLLSPFVIKLQTIRMPHIGTGTVAGEVFFFSTLGSIFGSLLTGFVLVPFLGLNWTILSTTVVVTLLGAIPVLRLAAKRSVKYDLVIVAAFVLLVAGIYLASTKESSQIYSGDGLYQHLIIYDGDYEGDTVRYLVQDRNLSSAMSLGDPGKLVFDYTKFYQLYQAFKPDARRSLVIGGAAYSVPKALLSDSSDMKVDVAEIDPLVYDLAKEHFGLNDDDRLHNYVADGRRFMTVHPDKSYDFIFSDVYFSLDAIPEQFTTRQFFELAKSRLSDGGVFMANLIGDLSSKPPSFIYSEIKTFEKVFDNTYYFAVSDPHDTTRAQNIIIVGVNGSKTLDFKNPSLANSRYDIVRDLVNHQFTVTGTDLAPHMVLTDDRSPVSYLLSGSF